MGPIAADRLHEIVSLWRTDYERSWGRGADHVAWVGRGGPRGHLWAEAVVKNALGACDRDPTCDWWGGGGATPQRGRERRPRPRHVAGWPRPRHRAVSMKEAPGGGDGSRAREQGPQALKWFSPDGPIRTDRWEWGRSSWSHPAWPAVRWTEADGFLVGDEAPV